MCVYVCVCKDMCVYMCTCVLRNRHHVHRIMSTHNVHCMYAWKHRSALQMTYQTNMSMCTYIVSPSIYHIYTSSSVKHPHHPLTANPSSPPTHNLVPPLMCDLWFYFFSSCYVVSIMYISMHTGSVSIIGNTYLCSTCTQAQHNTV